MQNQASPDIGLLKLMVLDATCDKQPVMQAATMQAVLESFRLGSDTVAISHQLILDETSQAYRVQAISRAAEERLVS